MLELRNPNIGYNIKAGLSNNEKLRIYSLNASNMLPITWRINLRNKLRILRNNRPFQYFFRWDGETWQAIDEEEYNIENKSETENQTKNDMVNQTENQTENDMENQTEKSSKKVVSLNKRKLNIGLNKKVISTLLGLGITKTFYNKLNKRSKNKKTIITNDFLVAITDLVFTDPETNEEYEYLNLSNIEMIDNVDVRKILFNMENETTPTLLFNMFKDLVMGIYCLNVAKNSSWKEAREIVKDDVISENHPYLKTISNILELNFNKSDDLDNMVEKSHSLMELIKQSVNKMKKMNILKYDKVDNNMGFKFEIADKNINMKKNDIMKGLTFINFANNLMNNINHDKKGENEDESDDDSDDELDGVDVISQDCKNLFKVSKAGKYFMVQDTPYKSLIMSFEDNIAFNKDIFLNNANLAVLSNNGSEVEVNEKYILDMKNNYILFDAKNYFETATTGQPLCFNMKTKKNETVKIYLSNIGINDITNIEIDKYKIESNLIDKLIPTYNMITDRNIFIFSLYSLVKKKVEIDFYINNKIDILKINNSTTSKLERIKIDKESVFYHNDIKYYKYKKCELDIIDGNNIIIINNDEVNVSANIKDIKVIIIPRTS